MSNKLHLANLYRNQMVEIKQRLAVVSQILEGKYSLGSEGYDYEIACIHIRKILELIAFSSLVASKEKYQTAYRNFEKHYKAKAILQDIEKVHKDFFPQPMQIETAKPGFHHILNVNNGCLTRGEFETLYDLCAKVLHVWNPFSTEKRHINFGISISEWIRKIEGLLDKHYVQLVDGTYLIVLMNDPKDGQVHVHTSEIVTENNKKVV